MKQILIVVAFWAGLAMVVGHLEDPARWWTDLTSHGTSPGQTIFLGDLAHAQQTAKAPTYAEVDTVLAKYHCTVCHGGADPRAGLNLESYARLLKGGKSGPVVIPGEPGKSELLRRLKGLSEPRMPYTGPPWLTDEETGTIEAWIAAGATEGK
jgi:hypothetical protein